jgi:hypothetical protein
LDRWNLEDMIEFCSDLHDLQRHPSDTTCKSCILRGYMPGQLYKLDSSYGSEPTDLLTKLQDSGIDPLADIVINHRWGYSSGVSINKCCARANSSLSGEGLAQRLRTPLTHART